MRPVPKLVCMSVLVFQMAPGLIAQFGPQESQGSGPRLAPPTAFPAPGTFPTTESVTLMDTDPQAVIHYTWDGSAPNSKSPVYDPSQLLFIGGIYDADHGLKAGYTLRAIAMGPGHTNSEIANFQYVVDRRDRTAYVSEEILPGVRMVRDSDNDKMFLVKGSNKFALIDSGQGRGELAQYLAQYTGGLPIEVIFTHNHGDHIGQADQFVRSSPEHIGEADLAGLERLLETRGLPQDVIAKHVSAVHDGDHISLGDRDLVIYDVPGHTPGSLVVFDERNGYLFTGDSYGSNSPTIPDALWMQWSQTPLDGYLSTVKTSRANFRGKVKYLMTGHNDHPLQGEAYLDNLEDALQSLMDKGEAVLIPSYRPAGALQVTRGDRMHDPNWVAINVNKDHCLPAPVDKIAGLTRLAIDGAVLKPSFRPDLKSYTATLAAKTAALPVIVEPTSTRSSAITVNGEAVKPGARHEVRRTNGGQNIQIHVVSPDGTQSADYAVNIP